MRDAQQKLGLSQEEFAARCDLHRNAVGLIERGERTPSLDTILAIADGLGISASRLVSRVERELEA